jgi:L-amino acid N-acyltransferase YncA
MSIVLDIASTERHFLEILQLQKQNLHTEMTTAEQAKKGFVFAEHTLSLLQKMAEYLPQVIALNDAGKVVAYNLAMHVALRNDIPSLVPMFDIFAETHYQGQLLEQYPFIVGGQVCVDNTCRGQGLLRKLYKKTSQSVPPQYQLCVTEVAVRNTISLNAHLKMGFEVINT